jgi:DNA repair exonuclease SbcCD nuclease subunit
MKLLHLADTHLGYSAYNKLDPDTGLNQREVDVYNAFKQFVDYAIDIKPDLVLHAGDLFDSVRPSNRAISVGMEQILRLSRASIPIVIIAGNHETPRLRETGSVFRLFEHLDNVFPVYKSQYEKITFNDLELAVHAIPHCFDNEMLEGSLKELKADESFKYNIGMLHGAVTGVGPFRSSEFNEQEIRSGYLKKDFYYIALGHYHEMTKVEMNTYYCGSTERFTFLEANPQPKGFLQLELGSEVAEPEFVKLPVRDMLDLEPINFDNIGSQEVMEVIEQKIVESVPENKIVRVKVQNIPSYIYHNLDFNKLKKLTSEALHFEIRYEVIKDDQAIVATGAKFEALSKEYKGFLEKFAIEGLNKKKVRELGIKYLMNVGAE